MFENAKVGDKVWCTAIGYGTISRVKKVGSTDYPIIVEFYGYGERSYTIGGKYMVEHPQPTLFWKMVPLPEECTIRPEIAEEMHVIGGKEFSESTIKAALMQYVND